MLSKNQYKSIILYLLFLILLGFSLFTGLGCGTNPTSGLTVSESTDSPWLDFWPHDEMFRWTYDRTIDGVTEVVTKGIDAKVYAEVPPSGDIVEVDLFYVMTGPLSLESSIYLEFKSDGVYGYGSPGSTAEANQVLLYPLEVGNIWGTSVTSECTGIVTIETALGTFAAYEILYDGMFHRYFASGIGEVKRTLNLDPPHQSTIVDPEGKTYITNTMETFAITEEIKSKNF